jgi:hypothetical protein
MPGPDLDNAFLSQLIAARSAEIATLKPVASSRMPDLQSFAIRTLGVIKDELIFIQKLSSGG